MYVDFKPLLQKLNFWTGISINMGCGRAVLAYMNYITIMKSDNWNSKGIWAMTRAKINTNKSIGL